MTTWQRVQGDTSDTLTATLNGVTDLLGVTAVEAHVWPRAGGTATTLTATVTSTSARTVTVNLGGGGGWLASAAAGPWNLEIQTTWTGGAVITWPEAGPDTIVVRTQGA